MLTRFKSYPILFHIATRKTQHFILTLLELENMNTELFLDALDNLLEDNVSNRLHAQSQDTAFWNSRLNGVERIRNSLVDGKLNLADSITKIERYGFQLRDGEVVDLYSLAMDSYTSALQSEHGLHLPTGELIPAQSETTFGKRYVILKNIYGESIFRFDIKRNVGRIEEGWLARIFKARDAQVKLERDFDTFKRTWGRGGKIKGKEASKDDYIKFARKYLIASENSILLVDNLIATKFGE